MKKLIVVNSHPIQYFAPAYASATREGVDIEVWYCSDESIRGTVDKQFGRTVKWDIPLLEGYAYRFFKNYSWKPSIYKGFWGLMNFGIASALFKSPKSVVIVHSWGFFSYVLTILCAKLAGHKVGIRGESPLKQEIVKSKRNIFLKKTFFKLFILPTVDYFLYVGEQNKAFYRFLGVAESKLVFTPYSVDNDRFQAAAQELNTQPSIQKETLGLNQATTVLLYSGKYIHKKRPLLLLEAYKQVQNDHTALIMVGDGELKSDMEKYISEHQLKHVVLTGFVNQSEIPAWYALADVFVMCSGDGETWGLSVNEAMNFSLPIVASDRTGCTDDLVKNGVNGFVFALDDANDLANQLKQFIVMDKSNREKMGKQSLNIIKAYSYTEINKGFRQIANF